MATTETSYRVLSLSQEASEGDDDKAAKKRKSKHKG